MTDEGGDFLVEIEWFDSGAIFQQRFFTDVPGDDTSALLEKLLAQTPNPREVTIHKITPEGTELREHWVKPR